MNKVIIYGTGTDAKECCNAFGKDNILFFVSDVYNQNNKIILGYQIKTFGQFEQFMQNCSKDKLNIDIIIAIRKDNIYGLLSLANKLEKLNYNYSIWHDVKKRWPNAMSYLTRDNKEFPYERESLLPIKSLQLEYLLKHLNPMTITPATGAFRQYQLDVLEKTKRILEIVEDDEINLFMAGGTLIGALRHAGYIPWDDDLDFAILGDAYCLLIEKLEKSSIFQVFYHTDYKKLDNKTKPVFTTKDGNVNLDVDAEFYCRVGFGYLKIYSNIHKSELMQNQTVCDIFPLYYFSESYTDLEYYDDIQIFSERRKNALVATDRSYLEEMMQRNIIIKKSKKVGYGHSHITSLLHWYPGSFQTWKMCDVSSILPLQKMQFETSSLWAPANPEDFLKMVGYENWNALPKSMPLGHHDAQIDWNGNNINEICDSIIDHKG